MNKTSRIYRGLILAVAGVLVFGTLTISAYAAEPSGNAASIDSYAYKVTTDMPEWKTFETRADMVRVSQIPDETLVTMSTKGLVETVMNYPLLAEIAVWNTLDEGYDSVYSSFNGLRELALRKDAVSELGNKLKALNTEANLDSRVLADVYYAQIIYDRLAFGSAEGTPITDYSNSHVTTPHGTSVATFYDLTWADLGTTAAQAHAVQLSLQNSYPNATVVRAETPKYNCHSYAWYSTSTSNKHWMNDPYAYMHDGSYVSGVASAGDKVYYGTTADHSGRVVGVGGSAQNVSVTSKWGMYGLFTHNILYCPYTLDSYSCSFWNLT